MLYLLVVRVFGTAAKKWYYLLILGWGEWKYRQVYEIVTSHYLLSLTLSGPGLPFPLVVVSASVLRDSYGTNR